MKSNLGVMFGLLFSFNSFAKDCQPKQVEIKSLESVKRVLASESENSLYYYLDMKCEKLMFEKTSDSFLIFARSSIKESIGENFCEQLNFESGDSEESDSGEAYYQGISEAAYSKLVDSLYWEYQDKN